MPRRLQSGTGLKVPDGHRGRGERGRDTSLVERSDAHATLQPSVEDTHGNGAEIRSKRRYRSRRRKRVDAHTLVASVEPYLAKLKGYDAETVKDMRRRLRNVCRDIWELWHAPAGKLRVATADIHTLSIEDIGALIEYWRRQGLKPSYQLKLLNALKGFLIYYGNPVVLDLKYTTTIQKPKVTRKDPDVLTADECERLRSATNTIDGWRGSVARLMVALLPHSGLRPSEFCTQELAGVDTRKWQIAVTHPKGEGKYANSGEPAPITPPARQAVLDFLTERQAYLNGERHAALVPWRSPDGSVDFIGLATLRKIKYEVEAISGVRFKVKDFRSTFGQTYIDKEVDTPSVSKAMRHSSTKTTEQYYGRIRSEMAFKHLEQADQKPLVQLVSPASQ